MIDAINYLYNCYVSKCFTSYSGIDYTVLAKSFYHLNQFTELSSLNLLTKGDYIYTSSTGNATIIYSDPVRAMNVAF